MEEDLSREFGRETMPDLSRSVDQAFSLPEQDWSQYAPLTLAFLGDCVFDMVIRTVLVKRHRMQAGKLHQRITMTRLASTLNMGRTSLYRALESLEKKNLILRKDGKLEVIK